LATKIRTPLDADEARVVLRRAAELDREHASAPPSVVADDPRLDAADLERIAAESGLSRESLRRAIDELRGGGLEHDAESPHRLPASPRAGQAVAQQTFAEPAPVIEQRLSAVLEESGLEPVRRAPHATRWEPAASLRHAVGRAVDWRGTSAWIGCAVESSVYAVPGERSSAELRGDAKDLRLPIATIAALLLAFPAGIALLVALAIGLRAGFAPQHALACLVIVASWVMLSALISRGVARRRVRKLQRSLERVLAQLGQPAHAQA
jgi:transposase-like protein